MEEGRALFPPSTGTATRHLGYRDMSSLADQIQTEIASLEQQMEGQKRLIRRAPDNAVVLEAAELELKALHTRLAVLKGNLKKCREPQASG